MSGPPVKTFSDQPSAKSGRGDKERAFTYFTPAKRRATQYEDVTIDTQPSIHRHSDRGWPVSFEDGRGSWSEESTRVRSTDWYAFRDPGQQWERTFYQQGAQVEAQIEASVAEARRDRLFDDFDPAWVEFLRTNLQVPAFAEHGLWLAIASIGRDALSDSLTRCIVFHAGLKQRLAQSIVLYGMDLEQQFESEFPVEAAKTRWLEHEAWQPTRSYVERLHATNDWGEVIVAANVCFEPLVGAFIRRELGIRAARANGDSVTPVIAFAGQAEWSWIGDWTAAFLDFVHQDEVHGDENRKVVAEWIAEWRPLAEEAAAALTSVVDELPVGFDAAASHERTLRDAKAYWEECGVD